MQLSFIHIFGPLLVIIAFWMFGRQMVAKTRGLNFRPLPAMLLMVVAIVVHFIFGEGTLLDQLSLLLMNFGIGMVIDAGYLAYKQHHPKIFWVPGVLALILSGGIYLFSTLLDTLNPRFCSNDPSAVELLVELGPDDSAEELKPILKKYNVSISESNKAFPNVELSEDEDLAQYYILYVDSVFLDPLMKELKADRENVDNVERNGKMALIEPILVESNRQKPGKFVANDPYIASQWYAQTLDYNQIHKLLQNQKGKKKAKVAIVDTGIDRNHEDLKNVYVRSGARTDAHGHGSHCSGLAGASTNNKTGIASMNWNNEFIQILAYPALNEQGFGTSESVAQGIIDAAEAGADVISLSLGGFSIFPPKVQVDAVEYALSLGAIVVAAAGNSNSDARRHSPSNISGVIVVSALNEKLEKASFSNTNTSLKMPIAAPGTKILSTIPGSEYQAFSGTSMATPIVSGLIGIMRAYQPNMTHTEVYQLLKSTSSSGKDARLVGRTINPVKVIQTVQQQ